VQERAGNILELIGTGSDFLNRTQISQQPRGRIDKWTYMKLKSFCKSKEMVTRLKRLPTEWEKIFAGYTSDKGLTTRIYREHKELNSPKINDPMKKWENELNRIFLREEVQMAKKQTLNTPSHKSKSIHVRTAVIKNTNSIKCWRGCGGKGTLIHSW
jgi:hypothetical protein